MRWLRDNWIDALIFTVFAITVVGIVLFLTGVNPFKPAASLGLGSQPPTAGSPSSQEAPGPEAGAPGIVDEPVTVVPLLPEAPEPQPGGEAAPSTSASAPSTSTQPASTPSGQEQAGAVSESHPAPHVPAGPEEGVYRVSVGAFRNPVNALVLAQKLEAQGYPVRLEPVGRITRVAVGPYTSKSEALEAARRLSQYEPQVYRGGSPEPGRNYLQVGAFKQLESAEATVRQLREKGFEPVVLLYQKPWIKVWVGPVPPDRLEELKNRLTEAGFDVVEVR